MYKIFKINELGEQSVRRLYGIRDQIDFSPYYQRFGNIWSTPKKQLLIDTIINGFDIPKFYFNYFIESNSDLNIHNKVYAIIDGKQRLQAIFDFLDNKFKLHEHCKHLDSDLSLGNLNFQNLLTQQPHIVPIIEDYILDIVFIATDDEDRLEELFLRLNGGVALNNAEKRNAIACPINERIREIIKVNDFFVNKLKFNNPRYQYNDLLTKLIFIEANHRLVNLGNKELELYLRNPIIDNSDLDVNSVIDNTLMNLDIMSTIFIDKDPLLKSKGIIPVYYQFIKEKLALTNPSSMRAFIEEFELLKLSNRQLEEPDSVLQEFDRLNQQGVHREKSLSSRFEILNNYFQEFVAFGRLRSTVSISNIEIDDSENYDEF